MSREELLDAVWPDTVVTDASLTQAVFLVRKALGETETSSYRRDGPEGRVRFNLPETAVLAGEGSLPTFRRKARTDPAPVSPWRRSPPSRGRRESAGGARRRSSGSPRRGPSRRPPWP